MRSHCLGALIFCLFAFAPLVAHAQEPKFLGGSYIITNDSIGQARDRWQSSVVSGSLLYHFGNSDELAVPLGQIFELRATSQIITPENLSAPQIGDRPFAGILEFGVATHGNLSVLEISAGADLTFVGPQTGMIDFQRFLHRQLGFPLPNEVGNEVPNNTYLSGHIEFGRSFGSDLRWRPFGELRAGTETLARVGVDLTWGALGMDDLLVREAVTGQRLPSILGADVSGWSWLVGGDVALVEDSRYLPDSFGVEPLDRARVRAGAHWQNERISAFYGLTWLSKEFSGQPESQLVGAAQLRLRF